MRTLNQTNLPVQPTPFLGRDRELTEVVGLLRREDVRLLTLTGPGGSGKTRLGLQAAAELVEDYLDGVWFVGLAALPIRLSCSRRSRRRLASAKAEVRRTRTPSRSTCAPSTCCSCSTASSSSCPMPPAPRRARGDRAKVDVVTSSRERLHLSVEHEFPVPPLSLDEAISLFAERARRSVRVRGRRLASRGRGHLQPCGPTSPRDRARGRAHQGPVGGADPRSARSTVVAAHDRCRGCAGASADAPGDDRMEL